jgi:hypothetical protein
VDDQTKELKQLSIKTKPRRDERKLITVLSPPPEDDKLLKIQFNVAQTVFETVPGALAEEALRDILETLGLYRRVPGWHALNGTVAGYWRHLQRDERPCKPCSEARIRQFREVGLNG